MGNRNLFSMTNFVIPKNGFKGWSGYNSDLNNCPVDALSKPSLNSVINTNGWAGQRLGYALENIDLGVADKPATSFYLEQYDVTVFALGTKVKYYDWTTKTVYDTGITLTDGTITRMDSYAGDVYLTNTTNGARRIVFGRINDSAANSGDATFTVDNDFLARLEEFSITSGNFRINGTNESVASFVISTGLATHSTSLSASYPDNAIVIYVHDISGGSGVQKASKLFFWKERMGMIGSVTATDSTRPDSTVFFGKFATLEDSGTGGLERIIDFTFGAGGSVKEVVGWWGRITNAVPAKDYLYIFKPDKGYVTAASDVVISGTGIGTTTPDLRDENNGCLNEDSACNVGGNEIVRITPNKRILRDKISTDTGAAVVFPDESFDLPIRDDLINMDEDQTGAMTFYHKAKRRVYCQIKISGQWYWYIYDYSVPIYRGSQVYYGAWQPPQQVIQASSFFERKGVLYATADADDAVYSIGKSFDDDGGEIECTIATGQFDVGSATMKKASLNGEISQAAIIKLKSTVSNNKGGFQSGSEKVIDGSSYQYSAAHGVGADAIGGGGVEAVTVQTAPWQKEFDIYPSEANTIQLIVKNDNGGYFSVGSFSLEGIQSVSSFSHSL